MGLFTGPKQLVLEDGAILDIVLNKSVYKVDGYYFKIDSTGTAMVYEINSGSAISSGRFKLVTTRKSEQVVKDTNGLPKEAQERVDNAKTFLNNLFSNKRELEIIYKWMHDAKDCRYYQD